MTPPRRILLLQLRAIGDVLLTTPALRVLKRHFPEAEIDFVANTTPAEVLQGNPNVDKIIPYPYPPNDIVGFGRFARSLRKNRYDLAIDFLGTPATALLTLASRASLRIGYDLRFRKFAYTHLAQDYRGDIYNALTKFSLLKPLGIAEEETQLDIYPPPEADVWADQLFRTNGWGNQAVVAIAAAAKAPARRWPPDRFAQVARWVQEQCYVALFLWGPGERDYVTNVAAQVERAVVSPPTTMMQVTALLRRCRLLITNCSGMKHFAVAVGTPTFAINGPTDPRVWTPPNDPRHQYIQAALDCLVCGKKECEPLRCMEGVSASDVLERIQRLEVWSKEPVA